MAATTTTLLQPGEILDIPFCFIQSEKTEKTSHIALINVHIRKDNGELWDEKDNSTSKLTIKYPVVGFLENEIEEYLNFNVQCGTSYECFLAVRPNIDNVTVEQLYNNKKDSPSRQSNKPGSRKAATPNTNSINQVITKDYIIQRLVPTKVFDLIDMDLSEFTWKLNFSNKISSAPDFDISLIGASYLTKEENSIPSIIFAVKYEPKYPTSCTASLLLVNKEEHAFDIPFSIESRDDNIDVIIDLKAQQIQSKETFKIPFMDINEDNSLSNGPGQYKAWIEQQGQNNDQISNQIYSIESKRSRSILVNFVPKCYGHIYRACLCIEQNTSVNKGSNMKLADKTQNYIWRCALRGWAGPNPIDSFLKNKQGNSNSPSKHNFEDITEIREEVSDQEKISVKRKKRDFIGENLSLVRTAASSTIKGASLNPSRDY